MLFILISFAVGLTLLYFKPELFSVKYKQLVCTNNLYDNDLDLYYDIEKDIKFNKDGIYLLVGSIRYQFPNVLSQQHLFGDEP